MKSRSIKRILLLLLTLSLILSACGDAGGEKNPQEPTTLVYANLTNGGVDRVAVNRFNNAHADVQIEVRDYFESDNISGKKGGWKRLLTEMSAGNIPDIIDMSGNHLPYHRLAEKGYLENLWPYIESDPDLGRDGVFEAPLRAAEVDGGLYILFNSVYIRTLIGAENVVGDRVGWSLAELRETLDAMPEGSTVMEYLYPKKDILYFMGLMSVDSYLDWTTGQCSFDSDEFRAFLEFCDSFPKDFDWKGGVQAVNEEIADRRKSGLQMLSHEYIYGWDKIPALDAAWGGRAAYIGFPTEDDSVGSAFVPVGGCLAMSSVCRNKEAAWEFIRQLVMPELAPNAKTWQSGMSGSMFLINRADYESAKASAIREKPEEVRREIELSYTGPIIRVNHVTEEECQRFETFLNRITKLDLCDNVVYDIVDEVCGAYFAGDRTLDDTVRLIENRVGLYLKEQM